MQTYGIYAVNAKSIAIKDDKDNGWVADVKWAFSRAARPERLLGLDHIPVLKGAAAEGGMIKLEVTPMLDGEALPAVLVPVTLRGNITVDEDSAVNCTTRIDFDALETAGISVENLIMGTSKCLECRVGDQPTLEESIQNELKEGEQVDADPLLTLQGAADRLAELGGPGVTVELFADGQKVAGSAVEEDMPFPIA